MWQQNVTYRSYTINYYNNFTSAGSPSNMPSSQSGSAASTNSYQVTLRSNTPTLSGYTFQGWCTSSSITNNGSYSPGPSCSGTKYDASGTVTIGSNSQTISLYVMWKKNTLENGDDCSHSGWTGTAKYYGGLCWMWTSLSNITYTWANAKTACSSIGWRLPSNDDFNKLLDAIGTGSQLYNAGWHDSGRTGGYWSYTGDLSSRVYYLYANSSSASIIANHNEANTCYVRCVAG